MLMIPRKKCAVYIHKREAGTHHEGDSQTSKAYLLGDRTPGNYSKLYKLRRKNRVLAFLYLGEVALYQGSQ
jgi:hypothetical protein